MRSITPPRALALAAAILLLAPAAARADSEIGYTANPTGGTGTITAGGNFVVAAGHTLKGIKAYAVNIDETQRGKTKQLVAGTDYNVTAGTWSVTLSPNAGTYIVYIELEVEDANGEKYHFNTPTVGDVTVS